VEFKQSSSRRRHKHITTLSIRQLQFGHSKECAMFQIWSPSFGVFEQLFRVIESSAKRHNSTNRGRFTP